MHVSSPRVLRSSVLLFGRIPLHALTLGHELLATDHLPPTAVRVLTDGLQSPYASGGSVEGAHQR